jgi:RimJ/RimL family protein N-acetyltransferase
MTGPYKIVFETDRLFLRQQVSADLSELWEFHCNPENTRYYQEAPRTLDEVREELDWDLDWYKKNDDLGKWAIIHKENGKIIGLCSLLPWTIDGMEEIEMAYILAEAYRGQGLGTELSQAVIQYGFESLNLSRIISLIEADNMTSRRVVEKVGLRFEKVVQDETGLFLVYSIHNADHV